MEITGNLVKHTNNIKYIYMRIINLYPEYNSYIMTINTYILDYIKLDWTLSLILNPQFLKWILQQ